MKGVTAMADDKFQSTPSARRATGVMGWPCCARSKISIHALREESDR